MAEVAVPDHVGGTPLVKLDRNGGPTVYGKAEWFNQPTLGHGGGSVKTRIGKSMVEAALADPEPIGDQTLIEASSGNTGAAVARFGAYHGYDVEIVMPEDAGGGKRAAVEAAGATTTIIDSEREYEACLRTCREAVSEQPDAYRYLDQYEHLANPGVHAGTTAVEIWKQTDGQVTHFVAGAGTGGTLVGVSHALRDRGVDIYGFEPATDDHDIAGLKHMHSSANYVPGTYDPSAVETMSFVPTDVAYERAQALCQQYAERTIEIVDTGQWDRTFVRRHLRVEGDFVVGPSSGACLAMVDRLSEMDVLTQDDVVVIPLPDRGDRYPERELRGQS